MEFFVAVIVVLVALNIFFFLIFRGITLRLGKFAQMNVLRQAGVFDDLIRKKQEQLTAINLQIAEAQSAQVIKDGEQAKAQEPAPDFLEIRQGSYTDNTFASEYRVIRDNFQVDALACVRESLAKLPGSSGNAKAAQSILDDVTLESAYELSTLSSRAQLEILEEMLNAEQLKLMQEYNQGVSEFQSYRFLFWLKDYVFANGDAVTVFTGSTADDFDNIDARIVTQRDDSICEGIYLLSKGRKYDYSIRNREIVG